MKKRWFVVVGVVVGVLAVGITGGAVLAHGNGSGAGSPSNSFISRVAAVLGLEESEVHDAFDQAAREMENEALQQKLDRLVAQGNLTQDQADEYRDWYQSRPDTLSRGFPFRGFGVRGFRFGRGHFGHGRHGMEFDHGVPPTSAPDASESTSP